MPSRSVSRRPLYSFMTTCQRSSTLVEKTSAARAGRVTHEPVAISFSSWPERPARVVGHRQRRLDLDPDQLADLVGVDRAEDARQDRLVGEVLVGVEDDQGARAPARPG